MAHKFVGYWKQLAGKPKGKWAATVPDKPMVNGRIEGTIHKLGEFDCQHFWDQDGWSEISSEYDLESKD